MLIIGCDFHPSFQFISLVDTETGETQDRRLNHPDDAITFYRSLLGQAVRIGMEATGNFRWFQRLIAELGFQLQVGDPSKIRVSMPRNQRTDKRDAQGILRLLVEDRFPAVWVPPVEDEQLRSLLTHRCRLVRLRTRIKNQLDGMAKNEGLYGNKASSGCGRQRLQAIAMTGWQQQRRTDLFALLDDLNARIVPLDKAVEQVAEAREDARCLMTHPGVGPVVSLAFLTTVGPWQRFHRGRQVASYFGLIPSEESSGNKRCLGHVSKQGNSMVRWLLVEAAMIAQRKDATWHRQYVRLSMNKHHGVAKVAIAHKLAVRLYWMLRSGQDYEQISRERGSHARLSEWPTGKTMPKL